MPKVINEDIINKIAEYAGKNYPKAVTAKELGLDRTTIRKYWPRGKGPEGEKEGEEAKHKLSIEEEFDLLTRKKQMELEVEGMLDEIYESTEWETEDLVARIEVSLELIQLLRNKLYAAESVIEIDKVRELAAKVKKDVTALLEENKSLREQCEEKERKKREEDIATRNRVEQELWALLLLRFGWIFPCSTEQAKKIVNGFTCKIGGVGPPIIVANSQLHIVEELNWGDNRDDLKPLINECVNLLNGNSEEKQRIVITMYARKEKILIPSDGDMRKKFAELLSVETNEKFVEMVLKFNVALGRLAEERYVDKEELLSKETTAGMVVG